MEKNEFMGFARLEELLYAALIYLREDGCDRDDIKESTGFTEEELEWFEDLIEDRFE